MRRFIPGIFFGAIVALGLSAAAQFTDVGGMSDVQEGSAVLASGLVQADIDLNGVYKLITDDGGKAWINGAVTNFITFATNDVSRMSIGNAQIAIAHHAQVSDDKAFRIGTNADFWHIYDETTTDDYQFWSTTGGGGTTDSLVMSVAGGDDDVSLNGAKGAQTNVRTKTEVVTFPGGGAATDVTVASVIPAGAFVVGVSTRVTTTATTCTSVDIGIAGKDTDAFADGTAVAAGVWAITVHYFDVTAATAD